MKENIFAWIGLYQYEFKLSSLRGFKVHTIRTMARNEKQAYKEAKRYAKANGYIIEDIKL